MKVTERMGREGCGAVPNSNETEWQQIARENDRAFKLITIFFLLLGAFVFLAIILRWER